MYWHTAGLGVFDNSTRPEINDETTVTTAPANRPNFSLLQDFENITSWHAAAFSDSAEPATHQALAPSAPIWLLYKSMSVTDPFIFSASAKAWRQRQIKVGVLLEGPLDKPWFLKCSNEKTFNWDMSNLSDSKHGKTIQKSTVSFSIYIQYDIQLDWEYLITQLDPRWTKKLQHLQTIQTSHCKRMSKTWHHDMPHYSAILRSPPHTRPWPPRHQSGCRTKLCSWRTCWF